MDVFIAIGNNMNSEICKNCKAFRGFSLIVEENEDRRKYSFGCYCLTYVIPTFSSDCLSDDFVSKVLESIGEDLSNVENFNGFKHIRFDIDIPFKLDGTFHQDCPYQFEHDVTN